MERDSLAQDNIGLVHVSLSTEKISEFLQNMWFHPFVRPVSVLKFFLVTKKSLQTLQI